MIFFELLHGLLAVLMLVLLIPVLFFTLQCWFGLIASRKQQHFADVVPDASANDILVLIPAHDEMLVIGNTLDMLLPQLKSTDRLLVVADNCHDDTASIVTARQQQVMIRNNTQQVGKSYALAFGMDAIRDKPPAILLIVDADCQVLPDFIEQIRQQVMRTGLPAQADNLMYPPADVPISVSVKISAFAVLVKNRIRMHGMNQLAGHVPLLGTGMAFPWQTIESMPLANAEIAEDIYLGLQLVLKQQGAQFAANAALVSALPTDNETQKGQRERWEQGHIDLIRRMLPSLLKQAWHKRSWP
ncbi:MAG: glycosyltransferase family 2 protein, partial [Methylophaga sp.]|nr:glycosyltransferase family 2 protein [Methylophaga sp.]